MSRISDFQHVIFDSGVRSLAAAAAAAGAAAGAADADADADAAAAAASPLLFLPLLSSRSLRSLGPLHHYDSSSDSHVIYPGGGKDAGAQEIE